MKLCPICKNGVDEHWHCSSCQQKPAIKNGFLQLAPEFDVASHGYDAENFEILANLEARNFWFVARNMVINFALKRHFPTASSFLEVGCGTGFVLSSIETRRPDIQVSGSEALIQGLDFAARRTESAELFQMDARDMPFDNEFDVIGAFDVLEHIAEDQQVFEQFFRSVKPGGGVLLTVPQHPKLWSPADEYAKHVRRYTRSDIVQKLELAGFTTKYVTSFVTLLLPLMAASRLMQIKSTKTYDPVGELDINSIANGIFSTIMTIERQFIKAGLSLPVGGSLLVVAEKK